jgi:hypothetical protein
LSAFISVRSNGGPSGWPGSAVYRSQTGNAADGIAVSCRPNESISNPVNRSVITWLPVPNRARNHCVMAFSSGVSERASDPYRNGPGSR